MITDVSRIVYVYVHVYSIYNMYICIYTYIYIHIVDCMRLFLLDIQLKRLSIKYVEFLSSGCRDLRTVDGSDSPLPRHLRCFR